MNEHGEWLELGTHQYALSSSLLSVVQESTKLQKEGLDTGADLAPLGRSEVEVIEEKNR